MAHNQYKAGSKEYQREYYQKNRAKKLAYQKAYNAEYGKFGISKREVDIEKKRRSQRNTARRKSVIFKNQNEARLAALEQSERVYTHSDLMQMPPEKLEKVIARKHFEMTSVR